jgi:hypothetical protein
MNVRNLVRMRKLPGPVPWPLFGNLYTVGPKHKKLLFNAYSEWRHKYGKIYKWFAGMDCFVVVSGASTIELLPARSRGRQPAASSRAEASPAAQRSAVSPPAPILLSLVSIGSTLSVATHPPPAPTRTRPRHAALPLTPPPPRRQTPSCPANC